MKKATWIFLLIILAACDVNDKSIYRAFPLEVKVERDRIDIDCAHGTEVKFDGIREVSMVESMPDIIIRTGGVSIADKVNYGNFKLEEIGDGKLYLQSRESPYVKIDLKNGSFIFINFDESSKTKKLYVYIVERMKDYYTE